MIGDIAHTLYAHNVSLSKKCLHLMCIFHLQIRTYLRYLQCLQDFSEDPRWSLRGFAGGFVFLASTSSRWRFEKGVEWKIWGRIFGFWDEKWRRPQIGYGTSIVHFLNTKFWCRNCVATMFSSTSRMSYGICWTLTQICSAFSMLLWPTRTGKTILILGCNNVAIPMVLWYAGRCQCRGKYFVYIIGTSTWRGILRYSFQGFSARLPNLSFQGEVCWWGLLVWGVLPAFKG